MQAAPRVDLTGHDGSLQLRAFPERDKVESCQHLELLVNESLGAGAGVSINITERGSPSLVEALQ